MPREPDLAAAIARVPELRRLPEAVIRTVPLPGLTNRSWHVDSPAGHWVLRMPGVGTERFIDRAVESGNLRLAESMGLTPEVRRIDPDGFLQQRFLPAAKGLTPARMRRPAVLGRVALALRRLHTSGLPFRGRTDLDAVISQYVDLAQVGVAAGPASVSRLDEAIAVARTIAAALAAHPLDAAPCHNDPSPGNLLDTGRRVLLVDWEYSSTNDPAWDLATVSVEADLTPEGDEMFLAAYHRGAPGAAAMARFALYRIALDVVGALWLLTRARDVDDPRPMVGQADARVERCLRTAGGSGVDWLIGRLEDAPAG
jgi:thiamine kinase-like enzyme